ncbi:hypothetical protein MA16_Dca005566 [Dendrobium catenatum]|uniref:Uncharacterized protein n=1 Tax=Dendrobium catenatum TaxID=906689 RepID=A0A2I0WPZ0_9ASPA|nr:hypothetical protein MA16_Dca005566 [Dendrobium catenatum]
MRCNATPPDLQRSYEQTEGVNKAHDKTPHNNYHLCSQMILEMNHRKIARVLIPCEQKEYDMKQIQAPTSRCRRIAKMTTISNKQ